ncbi:hypothetical protein [Streptomyces catenulae]|uniref:Translation initiation factor IF-2 n=1 Tax=Streptomyces catenulae TaxID=66875 RepID=A0ABV2YYW3_9ACTN|nr:hypothetical protein [Streptomyces catenulae]
MADQEKSPQSADAASGRLPEEDRHGFVSAFVGGVRSGGEEGRPGKRLMVIGIAVVAALGLGALAIGALTAPDDKKAQAADKVAPAGATAGADHHEKGRESRTGNAGTGGVGGSGGIGGTGGSGGTGGQEITPDGRQDIPAPNTADPTGSAHTPPSPKAAATGHDGTVTARSRSVAPAFTALTGYGCPSNATAGFWMKDANFQLKREGWVKSGTGGYTGSGCTGRYVSLPMSGSSTKYDPAQYVLWKFDYSARIKGAATCRLAVYIPDNPKILYVGGHPAQYAVYDADRSGGTPATAFGIDQVNSRGKWLSHGPFKVRSGKVTLRMFNTGVDHTAATQYAHDAAGPVQLTCAPA